MKISSIISAFVISFTLVGCAVGPLVSHETGRTVGQGNMEVAGGYGTPGYVFKFTYGVLKDLDIGFQWESLSMGVRAKYSFINNQSDGFSMALAGGTGSSVGGSHYYGDLLFSYLVGAFEPYATGRFVHVKTDPVDLNDKDTGQLMFTVSSAEYDYGQAMLGSRYWFNKEFSLSVEASKLFSMTKGLDISDNILVGAALGYKF